VEEATRGVEEVLKKERGRWTREKKEIAKRCDMQISNELAIREEQLRQTFMAEKVVAMAEAAKENNDSLREAKFKIEDKWKSKFEKLKAEMDRSKKSTARDVKQLTELHKEHVKALEKGLSDERRRLDKARGMIKELTMKRAQEAARNASDRETMAQGAAVAVREVEELRLMVKRALEQRDEAETRCEAAVRSAKRAGEEERMKEAQLQGLRGRLAEVEAEAVGMGKKVRELEGKRDGDLVELVRRENAVLRRDCKEMQETIEKMRGALLSVNKTIYGEKASDMCREVALGGGRKALSKVDVNKATSSKAQKGKPWAPPGAHVVARRLKK